VRLAQQNRTGQPWACPGQPRRSVAAIAVLAVNRCAGARGSVPPRGDGPWPPCSFAEPCGRRPPRSAKEHGCKTPRRRAAVTPKAP
jgi:hypothetical protein